MTNENYKIVVQKYEKLIFNICYQMVRDFHEAQNLTQDTFISAYINIHKCDPDNIKPWIARIATNKAKDYLKSAYIRKVQLDGELGGTLVSLEKPPDDLYIEGEKEKKIKDKIISLKEPYLKVSIMYFLEEKNVDEISKLLERPKKTVQTQILRAKLLLQNLLKEDYKNEGAF